MNTSSAHRLVVKVGTSTLTDAESRIDCAYVRDLAGQLAGLMEASREVILVTSGAIRAGISALGSHAVGQPRPPASLQFRQAAAAIGQGQLMHEYTRALEPHGVVAAQVLLTRDDLADRRRYLNVRNTFMSLLSLRALPIVNENDTVSVDEIKFGDNDMLAAMVAALVEADLLVILSDVEGLYSTAPTAGSAPPTVLPTVTRIDESVIALGGGAGSSAGTGGMRTKIEAARIATQAGVATVFAHGRRPGVLRDVLAGGHGGTSFVAAKRGPRGRKRWIAAGSRARGALLVNGPAAHRLRESGASLLPVGVMEVVGEFEAGDLVEIRDPDGLRFGVGLTNYGGAEMRRIVGLHCEDIEAVLGYRGYDEAIHRDNLVLDR